MQFSFEQHKGDVTVTKLTADGHKPLELVSDPNNSPTLIEGVKEWTELSGGTRPIEPPKGPDGEPGNKRF